MLSLIFLFISTKNHLKNRGQTMFKKLDILNTKVEILFNLLNFEIKIKLFCLFVKKMK